MSTLDLVRASEWVGLSFIGAHLAYNARSGRGSGVTRDSKAPTPYTWRVRLPAAMMAVAAGLRLGCSSGGRVACQTDSLTWTLLVSQLYLCTAWVPGDAVHRGRVCVGARDVVRVALQPRERSMRE